MIWEIEKIKPGVGVFEDPWITGFQIAFTPEIAQRDKITNLINEITISAKDQWTGMVLFSADQAIDTTLPDDPSVRGQGTIR